MSEPIVLRWLRILLGIVLIVFGANVFIGFMESPEFNEVGSAFIGTLFASGYVFQIMGIVFLISGVLFVWGKYKSFAALLLLPFTANILLFHIVLDINKGIIGIVMFLINLWMLWAYREGYKSLFS